MSTHYTEPLDETIYPEENPSANYSKDSADLLYQGEDCLWYPPGPNNQELVKNTTVEEQQIKIGKTTVTTPIGQKRQRDRRGPSPLALLHELDTLTNVGGIKMPDTSQHLMPKSIRKALDLLDIEKWPKLDLASLSHQRLSLLPEKMIATLATSRFTKEIATGNIKGYIHAFPVLKPNGKLRLIGHPELLNKAFPWSSVSPVKLGSITQLLLRLKKLLETHRNMYVCESDFCNFFSQAPLPKELCKFFGVYNRNENLKHSSFLTCVLCQGWGGSTSIAQALSWWCLAKDWPQLQEILDKLDYLPGYVEIKDENNITTAIIAIVYDNIAIFSPHRETRDSIRARYMQGKHDLNIKDKYTKSSTNTFEFLGLEGRYRFPHFEWRIIPETFENWNTNAQELLSKERPTPRDAMRMFGYLTRYIHVRGDDRYKFRHHSKQAASLSRALNDSKSWSTPTLQSKTTSTPLAETILTLQNTWKSHDTTPTMRPLAILTDASMKGLGYVALTFDNNNNWTVVEQNSLVRRDATRIEEEEANAVSWALTELKTFTQNYAPDTVIIAIDSLVVSRSMLRGASGSSKADIHIQQSIKLLEDIPSLQAGKICIADIKSEDNVADVLSRAGDPNSPDYKSRLQLSIKVLDTAWKNANDNIRWTPRHP